MLFGSKEIQEKLMEEVRNCEKERNIKIIYGALVGSISKGIQFVDSDYDTRFLYININFPDKILYPEQLPEEQLIYRKYMADTCFEKIPCWELSSFLQYLLTPSIDNKFSTGLYNVVGWTFLSPYTWDPYGLKNKIVPILQKIFHKDYFIDYHKKILDANEKIGDSVNAKEYLNLLFSALSIDWAQKYNEFPPIYLQTLLFNAPCEVRKATLKMVRTAQEKARNYIRDIDCVESSHNASLAIFVNRSEAIDKYIDSVKCSFKGFNMKYITSECVLLQQDKMKYIYELIKKSVYEEEAIVERW